MVDSSYRGLRLGLRVIEALTEAAQQAGCYKIILDCRRVPGPTAGMWLAGGGTRCALH